MPTGDPTIDRLMDQRDELFDRAKAIKQAAAETNRELTEDELKIIDDCNKAIPKIDRQLETVTFDLAMTDDMRDRLGKAAGFDRAAAAAPYRSVGQVVWDAIHADTDEVAATRYRTAISRAMNGDGRIPIEGALDRAAQHMGTLAADTTATAGDLAGVTVIPKIGPVINPYPGRMPLAAALGLSPAQAGSFERPYIVDTGFPDGVDTQALQKGELDSKAFTADSDPVKLATVGGYLNVSMQLLRWTPGALDIIIAQMNRRRSARIEAMLVAEMSESTGEVELALDADFATTWAAIATAAAAVGEATQEGPTVIAMGWDGYARLAGFVDAAGRPLFPFLGAANAPGTANLSTGTVSTVGGLTPVVTPAITDATFWILNGMGVEGHVYYYGVLEAVEPSVLGRQIAVAADFAALRPTPTANSAIHLAPAG